MKKSNLVDEVLRAVAEDVRSALGVAGVAVMTVDEEAQRLEGRIGVPPEKWPNFDKIRISLSEPMAASSAVKTGQCLAVEDAQNDPRVKKWMAAQYECASVLIVPIVHGDKSYGAVVAKEESGNRLFTPEEIEKAKRLVAPVGERIKRILDNEAR